MQMLHHANIVELYDVKKSPNNLYLVVEYCNSGNLERLLAKNNSRLSEYQALKIAREIVQGYRCLYDSNIVHRDLKPANLLLHNGEIKISDFGFSKVVEAGMEERVLQSYVGSPQYMSPQILAQEQYSSKTDVWSFG
jgi:serine/threonine-protein kinase ULK/ATG1